MKMRVASDGSYYHQKSVFFKICCENLHTIFFQAQETQFIPDDAVAC